MIKMKFNTLAIAALMIIGFSFTSCEKDENSDSKSGSLSIKLTDAPFPTDLVDEANVTINKIEIRRANQNEGDGKNSPFTILSEEEQEFNLLDLTNGVTTSLVNLEIEVGSYDLIRLYVSKASVKLSDGTDYDLVVPSGAKTGIKIFVDPSIQVVGGLTSELLLDFDVSKSFIPQGNMNSPTGINGFLFAPVIKASNLSTTGTLTGIVTDTTLTGIDGAQVQVMAADTVYTTSFTNESGQYTILGIDAGTYSVYFEAEGYEPSTNENIEIVAGNATTSDITLITNE